MDIVENMDNIEMSPPLVANNTDNTDEEYYSINNIYYDIREKRIPLIIDIEEDSTNQRGLSNDPKFKVELIEPFIIDSLSDIYLDSCMTINCFLANTVDNMCFAITIDQFNINTKCASTKSNQTISRALLIPNEYNDHNKHNEMILHKGKKMNYICKTEPIQLSEFTGTVKNISGNQIFPLETGVAQLSSGNEFKASHQVNQAFKAISGNKKLLCRLSEDHVIGADELHFYVVHKKDSDVDSDFSVSDVFGTSSDVTCTLTFKDTGDSDDWGSDLNTSTYGAHPVYQAKSLNGGTLPRLLLEFAIVNRE